MKIYTTLQRSIKHEQFCEDFLTVTTPHPDWCIGVVADGCSSGKDTHFASALQCKLVKHIAQHFTFTPQHTPQEVTYQLLHSFMQQLHAHQKSLGLAWEELLATLVIFTYQKSTQKAFFVCLGDGVVVVNQQVNIFDQHNQPDYPAYHLEQTRQELQQYFELQTLSCEKPQQFAIATDGVLAMNSTKNLQEDLTEEAANYLLLNTELSQVDSMLNRKCNILQKQRGFSFLDDIGIIRVIF
ncbi:MAG: protein phosphatase 2C domain-containing protein [Thermoflexibacteraceae bacterium]